MKLISVRWACLFVLLVSVVSMTGAAGSAEQGRWKVDAAGNCVFDETDEGPDQCLPDNPPGRWKVGSDGVCYFEQNDLGPNQCEPPVTEPTSESTEPLVGSLRSSSSTSAPVATDRSTAPARAIAGS